MTPSHQLTMDLIELKQFVMQYSHAENNCSYHQKVLNTKIVIHKVLIKPRNQLVYNMQEFS